MNRPKQSPVAGFTPVSSKRVDAMFATQVAILVAAKTAQIDIEQLAWDAVRRALPAPMGNKSTAAHRAIRRGSKNDSPVYRKAVAPNAAKPVKRKVAA